MHNQILYRMSSDTEFDKLEINSATKAGFNVIFRRTELKPGLVISRYSCLPYYKELEDDLSVIGAKLINSYSQHRYIANFDYYRDIEKFTAKTYFNLSDVPKEGKYVLKGKTNSRKQEWNTRMYSDNWNKTVNIYCELSKDSLIGSQDIIIRDYLPLKILGVNDITGQPFANEWRLWFLGSQLIWLSYYWSIAPPETIFKQKIDEKALTMASECAKIIACNTNFFVLDIAELKDGSWKVIEVNDGQMSGLPFKQDTAMYNRLFRELSTFRRVE